MKRTALAVVLCVAGSWPVEVLRAQEKPKAEEKATEEKTQTKRDITPLRVHVVIAEYEGDKKISSLPYTLLVNAEQRRGDRASIRMGLRVPISSGANQFQYQDVGTNIDGWSGKLDDGRFVLHLGVERSSTYRSSAAKTGENEGSQVVPAQPVIQQFKSDLDVIVRDGQTVQSTVATDPVSGRVTKVEVTANVMK